MNQACAALVFCFFLILSTGVLNTYAQNEDNVLTLDDAIDLVIKKNPGLAVSEAEISVSRSKLRKAQSNLYPQLHFKFILPFIERESGVFVDQLIWDFGRTPNLIKLHKANLKASKYDWSTEIADAVLNTKIQYYTALGEKLRWKAAKKLLLEKEKKLDQRENFLKLGRASQLDVMNSRVELGNAKLHMLSIKYAMEGARIELAKLTGIKGDFNYQLQDMLDYIPAYIDLDAAIKRGLSLRPELKSLKVKAVGMKANVRASLQRFYPTIVARAAYRFEGAGATGPDLIGGVGIKMPIFDGFSTLSGVRESKAKLRRTQAEIASLEQNIISDIKHLHLDLTLGKEKVEVTRTSKTQTEENYRLMKENFRLGRLSEIELIGAEALFESTKAEHYKAIYDYKIALAKLGRAIGESIE